MKIIGLIIAQSLYASYMIASLPSLADRRNKHWHRYIFKAIDGTLPVYIKSQLEWNPVTYRTHSSDWLTLKIPKANTKLGETAFCFNAPTTWNDLQLRFKISSPITYGHFRSLIADLPTSVCNCFVLFLFSLSLLEF